MSDLFVTLRGLVGKRSYASDAEVNFRSGRAGQLLTDALHGRYYQAAKDGELFHASSGAVAPDGIPTVLDAEGTTWVFALFNPASSGVDLSVIEASLGRGVTGDWGPGTWWWMAPASATSTVPTGTAMPVTAGRIGATAANQGVPLYTVTVEAANGIRMRVHSTQFENAIANTGVPYRMADLVDGQIIVPPGFYVGLTFDGNAGASPLTHASITWKEVAI